MEGWTLIAKLANHLIEGIHFGRIAVVRGIKLTHRWF